MSNCNCKDWHKIAQDHKNLFQKDNSYGWILTWTEIIDEGVYHKTHKYGVKINNCPFCGKLINKLKNLDNNI